MKNSVVKELGVGTEIGFCPDLDRGAIFRITNEEMLATHEKKLTLEYIKGRWNPPFTRYSVTVPQNYTEIDIVDAWFTEKNLTPLN